MKIFKIVVDAYPTPNGKPFAAQSREYWEQIEQQYFDTGTEEPPSWIPALEEWSMPEEQYESAINYGTLVTDTLMVPRMNRTHWFSRYSALRAMQRLEAWGCTVRLVEGEVTWNEQ